MLALFAGRPGPRIQGKLHPEKTQVFPIGPGFDSPHLHYEHTELIQLRKTRVLRKGARKI